MNAYPHCLCGSNRIIVYPYKAPSKKFSVLVCTDCGLGRSWPAPLSSDMITDFYEERQDFHERFDNLELWRGFVRPLLQRIKHQQVGGSLIDVGCNLGVLVAEARKEGYEAKGIDLSRSGLAFGAQQLNLASYLNYGTLADQHYPVESQEVLVYMHCLEHIEDPIIELKEAHRVLITNGLLAIEVPNYDSLWRYVLGGAWYGFSPLQHFWQFSQRSLSALLEANGFKVVMVQKRLSMYHKITPDLKGVLKFFIRLLSWLVNRGDKLIILARAR